MVWAGREGKRPAASPESPRPHPQQSVKASFAAGVPSAPERCGTGAAPRGESDCGIPGALPGLRGFPSALAPLPHALANDYISQYFPLPSGLCGEPRRLSPSPSLAGGSARRRGGARQPRPRGSRGPAVPPARAGAEPAALGGERGGGQRHAGRRLPPLPGARRPDSGPRWVPVAGQRRRAWGGGGGEGGTLRRGCCGAPWKRSPRSSLRAGGEGAAGWQCLSPAQEAPGRRRRQRGGGARAPSRSERASGPCGWSPARAAAGCGGRRWARGCGARRRGHR